MTVHSNQSVKILSQRGNDGSEEFDGMKRSFTKTNKIYYYYRVRPPVTQSIIDSVLGAKTISIDANKYYFSSLRAGLFFFLSIVRKMSGGKRLNVGIQAFQCNSVLKAILESGNNPVFHDISLDYFSSLPDRINYSGLDVLILTHLFGIPNPHYIRIVELCKQHGVILFDDLAMSVHTKINGIKIGAISDGCGYSYGFTKPMSCYTGGELIVNNSKLRDKFHDAYSQLPRESEFKSRNDLYRLLNYYTLTDPTEATPSLKTTNLLEPFLFLNGENANRFAYFYSNRINAKLKRDLQTRKIRPKKMGKRKIAYLEKSKENAQKSLETRDHIAKELLKFLKMKYTDIHCPVYHDNALTMMNWPAILVSDSDTKRKIRNYNNIQLGRYTWPYVLPGEKEKYPNAVCASSNIINIPNWDKNILDYI